MIGRSVVLVHGSQSDQRVWDPLVALAPAHVRVTRFDLPDHGRAPDEATPSPAPLRRALVERIEALPRDEPLVLVGHSMGAHLIASVVDTLTVPVERVFLLAGFDRLTEEDAQLYRAMADGLEQGRLDLELLREAAIDVALGERHRRPEHTAMITAMHDETLSRTLRSLRRGVELGAPGVTRYSAPATVVHGRDDAAIRYALGESLARAGERATLTTLDTDSHYLPLTHARELAEMLFVRADGRGARGCPGPRDRTPT